MSGVHGDIPSLVGECRRMAFVKKQISLVAGRDCSVLLRGESGAGKEIVARRIHASSPRSAKAFVAVDCTTLSEGIFESQLFGHVRGAFTGADRSAVGFVRTADHGTLFLDEIGELPLTAQSKLLRMLQERVVVPVGGTDPIPVDVRVIAATHRDIAEMVDAGSFRLDLFYRLNVVAIEIPPLRDRLGDLRLMMTRFLTDSTPPDQPPKRLTEEAWAALEAYSWPGNVRELENVAESVSVLCEGPVIQLEDLPASIRQTGTSTPPAAADAPMEEAESMVLDTLRLDETVRATMTLALKLTSGNQMQAAELLGIDRKTLARKMLKYDIDPTSP